MQLKNLLLLFNCINMIIKIYIYVKKKRKKEKSKKIYK